MFTPSVKLFNPPGIICLLKASGFSAKAASSSLAKLRKVTGHPFGFCREALAACDGDYNRAISWLQDEATKRGMAKADKLKSRPMSQGLLGLMATPRCVAAVEVNCETDFVARNKEFQSLVANTTESLLKHLSSDIGETSTLKFSEEALKALPYAGEPGRSVGEILAGIIGSVGENMAVPRGVGMVLSGQHADEHSRLMSYCHMSSAGGKKHVGDVQFGKYVAIVRYRPTSNLKTVQAWQEQASRVSIQLCQHIVGMNPKPGLDDDDPTAPENPEDEKCLLRQAFLLDESICVGALLEQNEIHLEDFIRVECGIEEE